MNVIKPCTRLKLICKATKLGQESTSGVATIWLCRHVSLWHGPRDTQKFKNRAFDENIYVNVVVTRFFQFHF